MFLHVPKQSMINCVCIVFMHLTYCVYSFSVVCAEDSVSACLPGSVMYLIAVSLIIYIPYPLMLIIKK